MLTPFLANILLVVLGIANLTWMCSMPAYVYAIAPICFGLGVVLWIKPFRTSKSSVQRYLLAAVIGLNIFALATGTYLAAAEYRESARVSCAASPPHEIEN